MGLCLGRLQNHTTYKSAKLFPILVLHVCTFHFDILHWKQMLKSLLVSGGQLSIVLRVEQPGASKHLQDGGASVHY